MPGLALVLERAATRADMKAKAVNKTLGDVEAEELFDTLAITLLEAVARRNSTHYAVLRPKHRSKQKVTLLQDKRITHLSTLIEVEGEVLVYAQADFFAQLHASVTDNLRVIARHTAKHTG